MGKLVSGENHLRKNRWLMMSVLLCILCLIGFLVFTVKQVATHQAAVHAHSFDEYVTNQHLGVLEELDEGTGLDPTAYVLQLSATRPLEDIPKVAETWMQQYALDDHGQILMIEMQMSGKWVTVAQMFYDDERQQLHETLLQTNGNYRKIVTPVDWSH